MNNLVICFVAAFCIVQISNAQIGSLDPLINQLKRSRQTVNNVIDDLNRAKRNLEFNLNNKLSNSKINSMQSVNDMTNTAMTEIRNAVNAAKEQGKNADHCLQSGRLALREISVNSFASLDSCLSNAKQGIVSVQNNMDATIAVAKQILVALDRIFPNCYSNNIFQMQRCITLAIGKSNATIRNLQSTAENVKSSGDRASSNSYIKGYSCFLDVVSSTRPKVSVAINNAKTCITNA